ncbi:MAG: TonB-dependent receptor, partial [Bacteroidota bacterium]
MFRLFILILMVNALLGAVSAQSLTQPLGQAIEATSLAEGLAQLEALTDYRFSYNSQDPAFKQPISASSSEQNLSEVLTQWLVEAELQYRVLDQQIVIFRASAAAQPGNLVRLHGYVREANSREPLPYTQLVWAEGQGVLTNQYGYFSLEARLPLTVRVSHLGHQPRLLTLAEASNELMEITLEPSSFALDSVQISASKPLAEYQVGATRFGVDFLRSIPTFLGERDVIKALQYLPGVQRANDGNSGLFVRGGNSDQNLILLDEAPVYNVNHLFGFFSVFNGDAVQSVEFIKGGFPAHYGGRLSSVVSITTKEGSREKWGSEGGIGLTSSRIAIGGPVLGKKGSLLLSARRTYWDLVVRPFLEITPENGVPFFFFHDYNAKLSYDLDPKNKLYVSAYSSWDRYGLKEPSREDVTRTGFRWQNFTATARWNRIISPKAFMKTSVFATSYGV